MPFGMDVDLSTGDFSWMGTELPSKKKSQPPLTRYSAHVYCGKTAGWMKTPLGTEVDLGSGHIVLDGD